MATKGNLCSLEFFMLTNQKSSLHAIYQIVNGEEQVKVVLPGSPINSVVYEAKDQGGNEALRAKFPQAYATFLNGGRPLGASLLLLEGMTREAEAILATRGIYTIEQLAKSSDAVVESFGMGGKEIREQAKEWMKVNVDNPKEELGKKLEEAFAKIAYLTDLTQSLVKTNEELKSDKTKKR